MYFASFVLFGWSHNSARYRSLIIQGWVAHVRSHLREVLSCMLVLRKQQVKIFFHMNLIIWVRIVMAVIGLTVKARQHILRLPSPAVELPDKLTPFNVYCGQCKLFLLFSSFVGIGVPFYWASGWSMLIRAQTSARRYELIYHYIPTAALPYQFSLSSLVLQGSIII